MDDGVIEGDEGWGPRFLSLVITLCGLVLFSTLVGTIAANMQARLGRLYRGRAVVLESGHVVILGYASWTSSLVRNLLLSAEIPQGH
jgi:hypothetical protein